SRLIEQYGDPPTPWIYVIVATGNIHEDARQAQAAARAGADVVAVIRSTAQSLIDYVPYGETTEGFGGTYATQANFRRVRAALDEVMPEVGRYLRLTNYASGLCMPEIAACGAMERLDMMLNDSMYGILFRDINPQRTFCDQYVSRLINGRAGIVINTGEDNYLTTAPAHEAGHTVVASNFVNRALALRAGIPEAQIGLGHAFEIDPDRPGQLVEEWGQALPGGPLEQHAQAVLRRTVELLQRVAQAGMFDAIEAGWFADTPRPRDGGRGLEGVAVREPGYANPLLDLWEPRIAEVMASS